jgi:Concanavalin A-like lectin/glucanases superfamily
MNRIFILLTLSLLTVQGATIAHYRFETAETNRPLLRLVDSSGNGHHGRVMGREPFEVTADTPLRVRDSRTALDARGRDDYAIVPHHTGFAPSGDWTIEFWIKPTAFHQELGGAINIAGDYAFLNTNLSYAILAKPNTNQTTKYGSAWAFHYQPSAGRVVATISYGTDKGETLMSGDLRDGEWHHIAMAFQTSIENEVRFFVDGFMGSSINQHGGNTAIPFGDGPIYIGAFSRQNEIFSERDRNFDGFIDEIRFSDAALDGENFVGNFKFSPVDVEIYSAVEIRFPTENGAVYRVEARAENEPAGWEEIGSVFGSGDLKSFFIRAADTERLFRVSLDAPPPAPSPLPVEVFNAAEVRFPTDNGQLYQLDFAERLDDNWSELTFILGDGAKKSYFERVTGGQSRFYQVNRY